MEMKIMWEERLNFFHRFCCWKKPRVVDNNYVSVAFLFLVILLTANVIVDSAFSTRTKTSAFKQWLSIQSSRFGETSTPGESTNTTSSRSKLHRSRGQNIRILELSLNFS